MVMARATALETAERVDHLQVMILEGEPNTSCLAFARTEWGAAYRREFYRLPTVDHRNAEPVCDFQIVSWQTNDAKGDMSPEEYLAHCTVVVIHHRLQSRSGYPSAK